MTAQRMSQKQASVAAYNRRQAMQVWRPLVHYSRMPMHPRYSSHRCATGRNLARHVLATLVIVGALVLVANI